MPINRQRGIRLNKFQGLGTVYSQEPGGVAAAIRDTLTRKAQARLVAINTTALVDNSAGIAGIAFTAAAVGGELTASTAVVISTTLDDWTRVLGSWIVDGFRVGDVITVTGSASNNSTFTVTAVTDLILTTGNDNLTTEGSQSDLTITSPGDDVITLANVEPDSLVTGDGPFQVSASGAELTGSDTTVIDDTLDTFTRDGGSWVTEGFVVGQTVTVTESASNNTDFTVAAVTALILTVEESVTNEGGQTDLVMTAPGVLPTGLAAATDFWVRRTGDNAYQLYTTKLAALNPRSTPVDLTTIGIGLFRFQAIGQPIALVSDDGASDTDSFTAASGDTSFDTIMTSYATLVERAVVAAASVGCGTINDGPGSGGSGTIAVTDVDVAANSNDATGVTFAETQTIVEELLSAQKTVANYISVLRLAVGLGRVPEASNVSGEVDDVGVNGAGVAITNCVTTDATTIAESAREDEIEPLLVVLTDNIALLADQLDEVTDITINAEMGAYAA